MKTFALMLIFVLVLADYAFAVDTGSLEKALPEEAQEIVGDIDVSAAADFNAILGRVREWLAAHLQEKLDDAAACAGTAVAVALLCTLAGAISRDGTTPEVLCMAGALAISGSCFSQLNGYLTQCRDALYNIQDFSKALLPCIAAVSAAAGHAVSGAALYSASCLFLDVLMSAGLNLILPMIYAYVAAATARAALPERCLDGAVSIIKWLCTALLMLLCTGFTLYLSLSGAVSGKTDALAASLTKTAVSAALPVVGKVLSDAASSYLAGAELLRSSVGLFGMAAVLCVCLGPVLSLGFQYLLFKAAAAVTAPFAEKRLSALIGDIGTACGMALGLVGSGGLMLFLSAVISTEAFSL